MCLCLAYSIHADPTPDALDLTTLQNKIVTQSYAEYLQPQSIAPSDLMIALPQPIRTIREGSQIRIFSYFCYAIYTKVSDDTYRYARCSMVPVETYANIYDVENEQFCAVSATLCAVLEDDPEAWVGHESDAPIDREQILKESLRIKLSDAEYEIALRFLEQKPDAAKDAIEFVKREYAPNREQLYAALYEETIRYAQAHAISLIGFCSDHL